MLMPYTSLNSDFQAESSHISTDVSLLTLDMFFAFNLGPLPEYQGKSMELGMVTLALQGLQVRLT